MKHNNFRHPDLENLNILIYTEPTEPYTGNQDFYMLPEIVFLIPKPELTAKSQQSNFGNSKFWYQEKIQEVRMSELMIAYLYNFCISHLI